MKRVCLWSGPRNISTAMMYSFAQRRDTTVVDEPLYAHYLTSTDAYTYHLGSAEVIAAQENDGRKVIERVIFGPYDTPVVFFKHMTHHLVDLDWGFMDRTLNLILTREPREMLTSFIKQIPDPTLADTGYPQQLALVEHLRALGQTPMVIDSKHVLTDPRGTLTGICRHLGIDFDEAMLRWEAGARPEDGVWARYWYHNVHRSTGFAPYAPKNEPLPESLEELCRECEQIYQALVKRV